MSDLPPPSSPVPSDVPPTPPTPPETPPSPPEVPVQEPEVLSSSGDPLPNAPYDKELGIVMHLLPFAGFLLPSFPVVNLIAPLALWLFKRAESPYLDAHGKEVLNFQITVSITVFVAMISCIGIVLLPVVAIAAVILWIIGAVKASENKLYRYPLSIRLIK